jgi:hypothetical protein
MLVMKKIHYSLPTCHKFSLPRCQDTGYRKELCEILWWCGDSLLDTIDEERPHASTLLLFHLPGNRVYCVDDVLPLISVQVWVSPRQPGRVRSVRCEP